MTLLPPAQGRGRVVAAIMAVAFILYLDRVCLAEIVKSTSFHAETGLTPLQIGRMLGAFFVAYALFQLPTGWISDRIGPRRALTAYVIVWSAATALTGAVSGFSALLGMRLLCGAGEAGAYPAASATLKRWTDPRSRARVNSLVTSAGRVGGAAAPFLTAWLVLRLGVWRRALWLDGAVGILVACLFWTQVRDQPETQPADRPYGEGMGATLGACCRSANLWLLGLWMFLINVGWAFLITWLPTYLKQQRHVADLSGGRLVTLVLACGLAGQIAGGWWADYAARRFGLKRGRILSLSLSAGIGGIAYFGCLGSASTAGILLCCGAVSFAVDFGNPASWAFLQDIGGRATATAFGWANMWGNFGAATISIVIPWLAARGGPAANNGAAIFVPCGAALLLASVVALGLDATKAVKLPA